MTDQLRPVKDLEPIKEDKACVCNCINSNDSDCEEETTSKEDCC
ncbi:MAG: hypothetical protein ACFFAQ_02785 [Promethearchaeota archaeon]